MGYWNAVASAGPYANNLHIAPDRQPHQHLARCSSWRPTNSVKALKSWCWPAKTYILTKHVLIICCTGSSQNNSLWSIVNYKKNYPVYKNKIQANAMTSYPLLISIIENSAACTNDPIHQIHGHWWTWQLNKYNNNNDWMIIKITVTAAHKRYECQSTQRIATMATITPSDDNNSETRRQLRWH